MPAFLTKYFPFSASFSRGTKIHGHNYLLGVTVPYLGRSEEKTLEEKIHSAVITKVHSKDLGLHTDFFKDSPITEENMLKVFWKIIEREIAPVRLKELSLERDQKTKFFINNKKD